MLTGCHEISLVPFTREWLGEIEVWFDHPEVRRWLGGRSWPDRELRLLCENPGGEFRGRRVLRAHSWVALDEQRLPVAHIGGDVYDRWTRYAGESPEGPRILASNDRRSMGLAYVVNPERWGQGFGRAALYAVVNAPETSDVRMFVAGIEPGNKASRRCALAAGFAPENDEPDWEGILYYFYERP